MVFFALDGVLRGFPAAAYTSTPHHKPLCGLVQHKKSAFLKWTLQIVIIQLYMDTYLNIK